MFRDRDNQLHTLYTLVSLAAVFSIVTQRSSPMYTPDVLFSRLASETQVA